MNKETDSNNIECGDRVKCKITGIDGIVVVRHEWLFGMDRIGIQQREVCDGKAAEVMHLDVLQTELLEKAVVSRGGTAVVETPVPLGARCRDRISGFKGICSGRAEWLYSCRQICVSPEGLQEKTGSPGECQWFNAPRVSLISKTTDLIKDEAAEPPGGPGGHNSSNARGGSGQERYSNNKNASQ